MSHPQVSIGEEVSSWVDDLFADMSDPDGFDIWLSTPAFESPWTEPCQDKLSGSKRKAATAMVAAAANVKRQTTTTVEQCRPSLNLSVSSAGLQALASTASGRVTHKISTTYENLGSDPDEVKKRLANATCACQGVCHRGVKLKPLQMLCQLFWSLSSLERGMLIRHEYAAALGQEDQDGLEPSAELLKRASWSMCGQAVCVPIFCNLLRTGEKTIRKDIAGVPDSRRSVLGGEYSPAPRKHEKSDQVDWFFLELYQSAAEPMPEDKRCAWTTLLGQDCAASQHEFESPWTDAPSFGGLAVLPSGSLAVSSSGLGLPGVEDDHVPNLTFNPVSACTIACLAGVAGLPMRYLPHCRLVDLYWQFIAAWDEQNSNGYLSFQTPPCFRTFAARWTHWKKWLRIRKVSQHAQCQTCFDLQLTINSVKSAWGQKMQAARDLRAHYRLQYQDRCIYWSMRFMSKAYKDVLTIIIDGMDKAKFAWPRWPIDRVSKAMEQLIRPKVCLTAAIAHGWCTCLFMTPEFVHHGSSLWSELICQVLEQVWLISKKTGRRFPRHLVLVADNTTGFAKNQYATKLAVIFVAMYKFLSVNLLFLIVGHTHEDIDQLFAIVLWLMLRQKSWESPAEVLKVIADGLRQRINDKGEILLAVELSAVRDFKSWMAPLGLSTDNCYMTRRGQEAPHSFSIKLGSCLTAEEKQMLVTLPGSPPVQPNGVYCCVKAYIRSTKLQQPPEFQMPVDRVQRLQSPSPTGILRRELKEKEITSTLQLAAICQDLNLQSAATCLRDVVYSRRYFLPNLNWLENFKQTDLMDITAAKTTNPFFPHLPEVSWRMETKLRT